MAIAAPPRVFVVAVVLSCVTLSALLFYAVVATQEGKDNPKGDQLVSPSSLPDQPPAFVATYQHGWTAASGSEQIGIDSVVRVEWTSPTDWNASIVENASPEAVGDTYSFVGPGLESPIAAAFHHPLLERRLFGLANNATTFEQALAAGGWRVWQTNERELTLEFVGVLEGSIGVPDAARSESGQADQLAPSRRYLVTYEPGHWHHASTAGFR